MSQTEITVAIGGLIIGFIGVYAAISSLYPKRARNMTGGRTKNKDNFLRPQSTRQEGRMEIRTPVVGNAVPQGEQVADQTERHSFGIGSIPWITWVAVAGVALAATGRHPYSFYTMTRLVVSGTSVLMVMMTTREKWPVQLWSIGFVALAILFNPIAPFYLDRETWHTYDIGAGLFFLAHLVVVRIGLSKVRVGLSRRGQQGSRQ